MVKLLTKSTINKLQFLMLCHFEYVEERSICPSTGVSRLGVILFWVLVIQ